MVATGVNNIQVSTSSIFVPKGATPGIDAGRSHLYALVICQDSDASLDIVIHMLKLP